MKHWFDHSKRYGVLPQRNIVRFAPRALLARREIHET